MMQAASLAGRTGSVVIVRDERSHGLSEIRANRRAAGGAPSCLSRRARRRAGAGAGRRQREARAVTEAALGGEARGRRGVRLTAGLAATDIVTGHGPGVVAEPGLEPGTYGL